jgi:peptide/nickel transport system ATP-binding protein
MSVDDAPLLSLDNVEVAFEEETAIMEAIPDGVKERFGWESTPVRAVDDVSIEIENNDVLAVIGESGSGKTTLGKAAVALQEPTAGTVNYRGHDVWEVYDKKRIDDVEFKDIRRSLQIVHQDPGAALNPYRTIVSILKQPLLQWNQELTHADCRERILDIFQTVGLTPADDYLDRYPHELSGGEQQRVALIRAMLVEPELILADEPVSALDPSLRVSLMDLMLELQEMFETSFLFISHNLEHARYIASQADGRIAVMYLGEIVEVGPAEEVIQNPQHPYTKILMWATLPSNPDEARARLESDTPLQQFEIPGVDDPPSGCRFHPRCPKARETCAVESPIELMTGDDDHRTACFRDDPDHEYWNAAFLDEEGEMEIPDRN